MEAEESSDGHHVLTGIQILAWLGFVPSISLSPRVLLALGDTLSLPQLTDMYSVNWR